MNADKYMSYLLKKYLPKNYEGKEYSWKEFKRRHKIIDYLFYKKFNRRIPSIWKSMNY